MENGDWRIKSIVIKLSTIYHQLNELQEAALAHSNEAIPSILAKLLPEFKHAPNKFKKSLNPDLL